jgi:hypothetical protein
MLTHLTPGIVILVSAIFVASITFLIPGGVGMKTFAFWRGDWEAYIGVGRTCKVGRRGGRERVMSINSS